jgi:hypothetical protein
MSVVSSALHRDVHSFTDTASPDDPNEISFIKGEILDILDKQGKWWQAKKMDGSVGSKSCLRDRPCAHSPSSRPFKLSPDHIRLSFSFTDSHALHELDVLLMALRLPEWLLVALYYPFASFHTSYVSVVRQDDTTWPACFIDALNRYPAFERYQRVTTPLDLMLPPELWINVFRWATFPPDGYPAPYYEPFHVPALEAFDEPLKTKRALVQVCRLWRALATTFLYEDVRMRHDSENLRTVLAESHSLGRFVHRLELPYALTATEKPGDTHDVVQILGSCPSLKTLVRPFFQALPYSVRYDFPAEIVSLSSLTRLEWWHYNNAARSGGINSLMDVLRNAPSLQFLALGGEFWMNSMHLNSPIRLPALTTLRLRRVNPLFVWQIRRWELPSLVHIVADFPADHGGLEELWLQFGDQLCTVEFGRNIAFHMTDQISAFLRGCAGVKVFNYFINFTAPPVESLLVEQSSLQCVGIHAFPCGILNDNWRHLNRHFEFLSSRFLPALKRIVLHGNWQQIVKDSRISPALDRLTQKGCAILFADHLTCPPCDHL